MFETYNQIAKMLNEEYGINSDNENLLVTCKEINDGYSFKIGNSYTPVIIKSNKSVTRLNIKTNIFQKLEVDFGSHVIHTLKSIPDYTVVDFPLGENLSKFIQIFLKYSLENYTPSKTFACCDRYIQCSDEKKCVHPNLIYSKQCWYRDNLEKGLIFYGKNKI